MNHTFHHADERNRHNGSLSRILVALMLFASVLLGARSVSAQSIPVATASASQLLTAINGNAGKIAANSLGDVFYVSQGTNNAYWLPRGSTTPIVLLTGLSGGRNVYVDSSNNVYVPSTYGGFIVEVPFVAGGYATKVSAGGTPACTSFNPVVDCQQGSASSVLSYYYQPLDVSMDAAGNLYAIDAYPNGSCSAGDCIVEFTRGTSTYNVPTLIKSNITAVDYNAQFNVAPNGDIYFANGKLVYMIAKGTTSPVNVGTFSNPTGVTTDTFGNVYVTNSSAPYGIFEFPAVGGVAQLSKQFEFISTYSGNSVAFDGLGDMFYTGYSGGVNLNVAQINGITVGAADVGTAVSSTATNITFTFSAATTVASITSNGAGYVYSPGSCTAGGVYAAASSCTVNVTYTPTAVGLQRGSISLNGAGGSALSIALLSGVGNGAAETNDPGTVTAIGSGFVSPQGIRVDHNGNVFVADAGQNAVLRYAGGTGTPISIGAGLLKPSSVTLDGAGNVFIADAGNGRIVEVPNINGTLTNSAQTVIATGLGTTLSIVTDRYGNLYIADGSKTTITRLGSLGGTPSTAASTTVGSGFVVPFALAVDNNANLFVADYSANLVKEINFIGQTQSSVGNGLSKPTGLVTDASGSLYIADSGNSRLIKLPLENGAFNTNDQYFVGAGVAVPYSVGIDSAGNLYVTDNSNATVSEINRVAGTLNFGRAQINTSTAASNIYVGNAGNQPLAIGNPVYTAVSTTPAYFTITSPSTGGCKNSSTLGVGFGCILSATFSPTTTGNFTDLLAFSTNAANGATQTLNITGRGLNLTADTITLTQTSPAGTASFGQPVTITATIATQVAGTPTGTVTFSVDGSTASTAIVIFNNKASVTLGTLTGGLHSITATYTGDDSYAPSNGSLAITVVQASSTTTLALPDVLLNPNSQAPGTLVKLIATVVPSTGTPATGGVSFYANGTLLNATPIPLASGSIAVYSTSALPIGTDVVTATYNGDVNYAASSGSQTVIISYPTFTLTPATATVTVASGQTGIVNLTVTSLAGFANNAYVGLTCAGLPANSACAFNPNGFVFIQGTPQAVTLRILTGRTPVVAPPLSGAGIVVGRGVHLSLALMLLALAPLVLVGNKKTRGKLRALRAASLLILLGVGTSFMSACGNGSGLIGITPSGTYNVTVTATSSNSANVKPAGPFAAGCTLATDVGPYSTTYAITCIKTAAVSLVVQ